MLPMRCSQPPCRNIEVSGVYQAGLSPSTHAMPLPTGTRGTRPAPSAATRRESSPARRPTWSRLGSVPIPCTSTQAATFARDERERDERRAEGRIVVAVGEHALIYRRPIIPRARWSAPAAGFRTGGRRISWASVGRSRLSNGSSRTGSPRVGRLVQRPDDAHVGQALPAGRLRLLAGQDALGEVQQLGRELVALREGLLAGRLAHRDPVA